MIVPRHPERAREVERELARANAQEGAGSDAAPQLLSAMRAGEVPDPSRPAIVDTIGELEKIYGLADIVFVGGSLIPHGGQNMLEPAAQGKPAIFGPHVHNFVQEAALLEEARACIKIASESELGAAFARLLADPELRERMSQAGRRAVEAQKGATERTLEALGARCL